MEPLKKTVDRQLEEILANSERQNVFFSLWHHPLAEKIHYWTELFLPISIIALGGWLIWDGPISMLRDFASSVTVNPSMVGLTFGKLLLGGFLMRGGFEYYQNVRLRKPF